MNEAADMGGNLPAIILFWAWWVLVTVVNTMSEISRRDAGGAAGAPAGDAAATARARLDPVCREKIRRIDPTFDEVHFLQGALKAYGIVLEAYAAGDLDTLRRLVAPDVLAAFDQAIAGRIGRGETMGLTLVGLGDARIVDVEPVGSGMAVGVRFAAEVVSVTRLADGTVIDGDPERTIETQELWTFEPDPASAGRSWLVTATDGA